MNHRKIAFLQEVGITRWQLRKPQLLVNCAPATDCPPAIDTLQFKLLVICHDEDKQHPLMAKIISAFNFELAHVYFCSMRDFENQQSELPAMLWSTLGELEEVKSHQLLNSPAMHQLSNDPVAKKQLWKQFSAFNQ
ncbi:MAG TPA: DNA polymerase III subunit psi [Psychromonas hadalis]|nr:DNA polymerase III subunit psi [Psychromonas hadalis]